MIQDLKFKYETIIIGTRQFIDWRDTINSLRILLAANPTYTELEKFIDKMDDNYSKCSLSRGSNQ